MNIGVLVSGRGSNLQSIIDNIKNGYLDKIKIQVVISNNPNAFALKRAQKENIPTKIILPKNFNSREEYDIEIVKVLKKYNVDYVVLAGYMRILSPPFIKAFPNKIINIHPALLPSFPGLHAQRQALKYGVKFSGCTVHFVDEDVDTGPIIFQSVVPVFPDDDEETLSRRILKQEHYLLPKALKYLSEKKVVIKDRTVYFN